MINFPKNFYWGTATSAHQVEGNNKNNDWWQAEQKAKVPHKSESACDSYNRYEEDFGLAKELGTNAHRLSIEWSRVEPKEGEFDEVEIEHYRKVIKALKSINIEPFVTLHHFTNPAWFATRGGWDNPRSPFYFARYAEYVVKSMPEVKYWITINEPMVLSFNSFFEGKWPPFKKNFFAMNHVIYNMTQAHKGAYKKLKAVSNNFQIGIAKNNSYFDAYENKFLSRMVMAFFNYFWNIKFLESIKNYQDFVGINYYFHNRIRVRFSSMRNWVNQNKNKEISDIGWEIYPEGLYHVVKHAAEFEKPIYIFENGIADADDNKRSDFIKNHLKWLHKAIEEGADVKGYFYWSLLDNFEWLDGFNMRFGLVEVNFSAKDRSASGGETLKRKSRKSFDVYKNICKNNGF